MVNSKLRKRPAAAPKAARRCATISPGAWEASAGVEVREKWVLEVEDRQPWPVPGTPCASNVRVVVVRSTRAAGTTRVASSTRDEVFPSPNVSDAGRVDLRISLPFFGRVYLHVVAWWLLRGRPQRKFATWAAFRQGRMHVDHGDQGMPHNLDYRTLSLKAGSGPGSNPSQGAALRNFSYARRGGLRNIVAKRPAALPRVGRFARRVSKKACGQPKQIFHGQRI